MDEARRRDKLDDTLLFAIGSVGILFGVFQAFVRPATLLQFLIPAGLLAWVLPFYYGHVRGAVRAVFYSWRSDYYAARIFWPFVPTERKGRLRKFGKIGRASKILSRLTFAVYVSAGALALLIDFNVSSTLLSQPILTLFFEVLGLAAVLAVPTLILDYLTRTVEDFDFHGPFPEKPQVNHPI